MWPELPCVEEWPVWCVVCFGFVLFLVFVVAVGVDAVVVTPLVDAGMLAVGAHGPTVSS